MIISCNFSICDTTIWILDTKSLINIYNSLRALYVSWKFREGEWFPNIGDRSLVPVLALGTMQLILSLGISY